MNFNGTRVGLDAHALSIVEHAVDEQIRRVERHGCDTAPGSRLSDDIDRLISGAGAIAHLRGELCRAFGGFLRGFQLFAVCRELSHAGVKIARMSQDLV